MSCFCCRVAFYTLNSTNSVIAAFILHKIISILCFHLVFFQFNIYLPRVLVTCFMLVSFLACSSTLRMEVTRFSETLSGFQQSTQRCILEGRTLHNHCCENLKSYKIYLSSFQFSLIWLTFYIAVVKVNKYLKHCLVFFFFVTHSPVFNFALILSVFYIITTKMTKHWLGARKKGNVYLLNEEKLDDIGTPIFKPLCLGCWYDMCEGIQCNKPHRCWPSKAVVVSTITPQDL
jgi:hypothetical protein